MNLAKLTCLLLTPLLALTGVFPAHGGSYPAAIKHYQTMTKLLDETQLQGWPSGSATAGRHIEEMVAHRDGADLAFTVTLDATSDKHLYVLTNGLAQLVDCTSSLNAAGINPNNVYGLRWSHEGKRLFFLVANTYDMYYYLILDKVYPAFKGVPDQGWVPWPYSVNYDGTRIFFKGGLSGAGGLYYSDVPGPSDLNPTYTLHPMLLMNQLPGPQNWNVLRFLGASNQGGSLLCTYFGSAADNSRAMWLVPTPNNPPNPSQAPVKVLNEEHTSVWMESNIPDKIIDSGASSLGDGPASVLYACQDSGQNEKLYYVPLGAGTKQLLSADGGTFLFPTLYDDNAFTRFARFTGPGHKATVVNLLTGEQRDTHSWWFAESSLLYGSYYLTDLTDDSSGHFANDYFMASKTGSPSLARLDLIDMAPFYRVAPIIDIINFSKPMWLFDGTMPLTITVHVSGGGTNILWVKLLALVDGLEQPVWLSGKPFSEGQLSDQGGGVYTFTTTLNKSSNFFTQYKLPKDVGIRIIAKNAGEHYGITDTTIRITTRGALSPAARNMLLLSD